MLTAYKVVKRDGEILKSASATHCALTYEVGSWTRPIIEHSKIFVFENLEVAKDFRFSYRHVDAHEIWLVEVEDLTEIRYLGYCTDKPDSVTSLWKYVYSERYEFIVQDFLLPPFGTKGSSAIRLIEKISLDDLSPTL